MAFNPSQPRIPKGSPGAGRFMKVGQVLSAAARSAGDGGGRRGDSRAARVEGAFGRSASRALFPEDEGRNPLAKQSRRELPDVELGEKQVRAAPRQSERKVKSAAFGAQATAALFPEDVGSGPLAKRPASGSTRTAPLARAGEALTGKETKAQLREIAAGEGITVGRGSREQMAQTIRDFRHNREHGGTRLFGETDFAREMRENPIAPTPRRRVAAPARRTGPAIVDEANQDLAGKSTAQLRAVAAAEGIPVTKGAGKQTLVNEISHGRNVRHRGGGRLLAPTRA